MSRVLDLWAGMTGAILPYAFSTPPANNDWLLCDGRVLTDATPYTNLRQKLLAEGSPYGKDASNNPRIPDLRGRVPAGKDNMGGTAAGRLTAAGSGVNGAVLGGAGGAELHTLTPAQMPSHAHGVSDPTHAHSVYDPGHSHTYDRVSVANGQGSQVGTANNHTGGTTSHNATGIGIYAAYTGISIQAAGGNGAHNNTQPTLVTNYIIKT